VKFINKTEFANRIQELFHPDEDSWLYNYFPFLYGVDAYSLAPGTKLHTLIDITLKLIPALGGAYPVFAFPDGLAGWRDVPKNRKLSPIQVSDPDTLSQLLTDRIHFGASNGPVDNYHIADSEFRWVVVFSHEGRWLFYGTPELRAIVESI
jgi:hypothetical protein